MLTIQSGNKPEVASIDARGPTLQRAVFALTCIVSEPASLDSRILPCLEQAEHAEDWYVARRDRILDGSCSLQVFVWPPGSATRVHDHTAWGAFCCVVGTLLEARYERLDDGARPEHARLREAWRRTWRKEDGASVFLSHEGGIHRVGNVGDVVAISVHVYGPRLGEVDGRDYDPLREYVCDRPSA